MGKDIRQPFNLHVLRFAISVKSEDTVFKTNQVSETLTEISCGV